MQNYYSVSPITGKPTGIRGFEYDDQSITVYFTTGASYHYTYVSASPDHIENMKQLANQQEGLNTYLTKAIPRFAWKRK